MGLVVCAGKWLSFAVTRALPCGGPTRSKGWKRRSVPACALGRRMQGRPRCMASNWTNPPRTSRWGSSIRISHDRAGA